jgi:hypothetical protein
VSEWGGGVGEGEGEEGGRESEREGEGGRERLRDIDQLLSIYSNIVLILLFILAPAVWQSWQLCAWMHWIQR